MEAEELDAVRDELFRHAEFCGVRILAFSLLPTSFDLLLEIPTNLHLSKKEMMQRIKANLTQQVATELLDQLRRNDPDAWLRAESYFGSASILLKRFKHSTAIHYHQRHNTSGTLWGSRFSSSFVEPGHAARVVAAWVDHGCVRHGSGPSPEEYPHCTIGHAVSGNKEARAEIAKLFLPGSKSSWSPVLTAWRDFCSGEPESPKPTRAGTVGPPLNRSQLLRHPVPHFHGGLAIGSRDFVERVFELNSHYFSKERATGARFITGQNDPDFFTLRDKGDLRKPPRSQRGSLAGI
jgi:REP element-mobilizing transposase RayT